jgi:hypothetical protein
VRSDLKTIYKVLLLQPISLAAGSEWLSLDLLSPTCTGDLLISKII